jgi:protoheme IX farnesyltransferase
LDKTNTYTGVADIKLYTKMDDYSMLVKLRLNLFVVFSSVLAYFIVAGSTVSWLHVGLIAIGGFLITSAANTLNQVLEKDFDKLMTRTANRPLAAGRMKVSEAVIFAGLTTIIGVVLLAMINPLVVLLSMLSLVSYAFLYTPLKRHSTLAVAVGAIPGALPVMIGGVAAEGQLTLIISCLFFIQFLWQFPHFWAIAYLAFDDYHAAGYKLLPVDSNDNIDSKLGLHASLYALLIIPFVVMLYISGEASIIASIVSGLMALVYLYMSLNFYITTERRTALGLMFSSFLFLPVVLISYWVL